MRVPATAGLRGGNGADRHAAMGEPIACVAHSLRLSGLRPGDRVAIIGAGYMGRLHLSLARLARRGHVA